jgi:hypothetical protein
MQSSTAMCLVSLLSLASLASAAAEPAPRDSEPYRGPRVRSSAFQAVLGLASPGTRRQARAWVASS